MRKTQMSIVVNGFDQTLMRKALEVLNHFEAVTMADFYDKHEISSIHLRNKSAAFITPFQMADDLKHGVIVLNVFSANSEYVDDHFENVVIFDGENTDEFITQVQDIATKYGIDLGDYIATEKAVKQPSKDDCLLCKIYREGTKFVGNLDSADPKEVIKTPLMNIILYESEHFYVVPVKGALVPGYVMIVPKEHVWSFAALSREHLDEALEVLEDVQTILSSIFNSKFVIFEHGSGAEGKCKHEKAIVHAHLHVVPASLVMTENVKCNFHLTDIGIYELNEYAENPYLLYMDSETPWCISADPEVYIPRQCVRQLLGDAIGLKGNLWNWRNHSFVDNVEVTVNRIYDYLKRNFFKLDDHIIPATENFLKEMDFRKKNTP